MIILSGCCQHKWCGSSGGGHKSGIGIPVLLVSTHSSSKVRVVLRVCPTFSIHRTYLQRSKSCPNGHQISGRKHFYFRRVRRSHAEMGENEQCERIVDICCPVSTWHYGVLVADRLASADRVHLRYFIHSDFPTPDRYRALFDGIIERYRARQTWAPAEPPSVATYRLHASRETQPHPRSQISPGGRV